VHITALEAQLEFERLVAGLSSEFTNLPFEQIDDAIADGLRQICELVAVDRGTFYEIGRAGVLVDPVSWTAPKLPPLDARGIARRRFPWSTTRIQAGEVVAFSSTAEIPDRTDRSHYQEIGILSAVVVPLRVEGSVGGAVAFHAVRAERTWSAEVVRRLTDVAGVFAEVLARRRRAETVCAAAAGLEQPEDHRQVEPLESENLRQEVRERLGLPRLVGKSAAMRRVLQEIEQVAATGSTVLLLGETGTGKELFASQIHARGPRRGRAMVRVNCAAIPATLMESELFGRERGAYTGADARQIGRFELAHKSTIFLDEIGDLPPDVQVKLLRVLEERQFERLGNPRSIAIDTRIIAATHRKLDQRIAEGTFREDLFYRLNVFPIYVPPLRERVEDIPLLVWRFVEELSTAFGKRVESIDDDNLAALQQYSWPGNIRELRNVVERAMILSNSSRLSIPMPLSTSSSARRSSKLVDVEREHIRDVLESTAWRIRGAGGAAERLGLKPTTLETRMVKLGLKRLAHS
jgi:transcriptional regulator with GAF, ATPase, and Fis domain